MASLQRISSGTYYILFRFGGNKYKRSLKTQDARKAKALKARLEESIHLINGGRLELPINVDVPTFLLSDGKLATQPLIQESRLSGLFDLYFDSIPPGTYEPDSLKMLQLHRNSLERVFGAKFNLRTLGYNDLQSFVNRRALDKGRRGKPLNAATIKKEISTLRGLWKWAASSGKIPNRDFPSVGLRYPKTEELPPFQTFAEVSLQTASLSPDSTEWKELWATVFLDRQEVEELLDLVQEKATHAFVYPMFVFAAHTGARRSEISRSQTRDVLADTLTIHERKKKKRRNTTRRVPISKRLRTALDEWFEIRPKSPHTICHVPTALCRSSHGDPLSPGEMNNFFRNTLQDSRFQHLRGWHVFRHSFCSNCAAAGIDQRIIDSWVGHTTEEMRRRYRHLFPNAERSALEAVLG